MRRVWYTIVLAIMTGAASLPAAAQHAAVRGQVVDKSSGAAITGASVEIFGIHAAVLTDAQGRFAISGVATGAAILRVKQLGYGDAAINIAVSTDMPALRIELEPSPVVLEGLEIVASSFSARSRSIPYSVRSFTSEQVMTAASFDLYEFLRDRIGMVTCPPQRTGSLTSPLQAGAIAGRNVKCVLYRGNYVIPTIMVDDALWVGDVETLRGWSKSDIHRVDAVKRGTEIWIFTRGFAERVARGEIRLRPYPI